ncbi:MAG: EAL domain-containing protein [Rubrivivax sp.]|nr:EAL domain-containing protein [Rubrivivax sp.]
MDDDDNVRQFARAALSAAGFAISEASDGWAALAAIRRQGMPDLVLLDVSMPTMDGLVTCAELRRLPGGDSVPVVAMTGPGDTRSIERAFAAGATDFVPKPIEWVVLPHRVRCTLRASAAISKLQRNERRLSNAQRIGEMGDWEWNVREGRVSSSEQAWRIFGHAGAPRSLTPAQFFAAVHADDAQRVSQAFDDAVAHCKGFAVDYRLQLAGGVRHVQQQVEVAARGPDGRALRLAGVVHDITRRKDDEEQIRRLAYYDPLTGLPNRLLFAERLERAMAQAKRHGRRLAILFVDLDNFKRVNDTLGHRAGDELLRNASARLASSLRTHDAVMRAGGDGNTDFTDFASLAQVEAMARGLPRPPKAEQDIARLGGDEFIVLLTDVESPNDVVQVAQRLVQTLAEPIVVQGTEVFVGGSIGIAVYPEDGGDIDTLLMNADTAMYRAKAAGRGGFQLYDRSMNARALDRLHMETRLRRALERDEFVLHYQPRVDVVSGCIVGAEALIRWQHPERGLLLPAEFIPLVEDAGLVVPIGEWAIETVCRQSAAWRAAGLSPVPVAVNLAATHLRERGLPALVARALARHGVPARGLEIEVTESILLADPELSVSIAQQLAAMGVELSIDDFGTGYSSMSYLKKLPIAALKIDRSFVRDLESDPDDAAIVSAIVALAHSLKLKVVAEGVETAAQLAFLQSVRCDEYQGFLTSRAVGVAEFERLLRRRAQIEGLLTDQGARAPLVL